MKFKIPPLYPSLILLSLLISATYILFLPAPPRIESTLPIKPIQGMESLGYSIYGNGLPGTASAIGQLFSPNVSTPILFKLGFLISFLGHEDFKKRDKIKFQIRLSEWLGDRPSPSELWVSNPSNVSKNFKIGWVDFEVPHIELEPNKKYIVWITLSDLDNIPGTKIDIKASGPSFTSHRPANISREEWLKTGYFAYPEGTYVLFKQVPPNRTIRAMTSLPWEKAELGFNLHFRMTFENLDSTNKCNSFYRKKAS